MFKPPDNWHISPMPLSVCSKSSKLSFNIGEGNGSPLQYSCLENPMDGGAWWAAVHGVAEGWTRLSDFTFTFHFHALEKEMATCSSVLAWRIPGTGEPGGLPSMGSHRVGHDWSDLAVASFNITWTEELPDVQIWFRKGKRNQRSNCQHFLDHSKSKRIPEKKIDHSFIDYVKAFDHVDHYKLENS